jgi:hypothetical protein
VTGELWCLHLEWRLRSLKAVRAAGIESGEDLIGFNHREFWQKRLLLFDVDRQRLGRLIRNSYTGKEEGRQKLFKVAGTESISAGEPARCLYAPMTRSRN